MHTMIKKNQKNAKECDNSMYGGEERRIQGFGGGNIREIDHLKVLAFDGSKMDLQELGCGGMDWIELAQDRDRWRALVTAVMNLRVP